MCGDSSCSSNRSSGSSWCYCFCLGDDVVIIIIIMITCVIVDDDGGGGDVIWYPYALQFVVLRAMSLPLRASMRTCTWCRCWALMRNELAPRHEI